MSAFYDWAFKDGGDSYFALPLSPLLELDSFWRDSAIEVGAAVMHLAREMGRKFDPATFRPTTAEIAALIGRSCSFVQKGLYALDVKLDVLDRTRKHGGRFLGWVRGLKPALGSKKGKKADDPAPLCTPPPEREIQETTTTGKPSSSSFASLPGEETELPPELVEAVGLVPGLTEGQLLEWIRRYDFELTRRGVDWLKAWLCHPEPSRRPGANGNAVYWTESALLGWKRELDLNIKGLEDIDQQIDAKRRKWGHRDPAAQARAEAERKAKARAELERTAAEDIRTARLGAAWSALDEARREEIRAAVKAAHPHLARWPSMLEDECRLELERRQAAEASAPHRRE